MRKNPRGLWPQILAVLLCCAEVGYHARADDWFPPAPTGKDGFDWIQLKSGEWLKGRIKSMQEERLEFDSEELDLMTFDWDKILTVRSPRFNSVGIENKKPVNGALLITTNEVRVISSTATNIFRRSDLLAITPTGNREIDKWTGKISAGVSYRSGNTHEADVNSELTLKRRTPDTRLNLNYLGNYGRVNDTETEQNHRAIGQFDYFLSRRLYTRLPDVEYYRDPLQNIDHRLTLGGGVGYDFLKTSRTEWNATLGPAWQRNWFESVSTGESTTADSLALVFSTHVDVELTKQLDWIFDYRGQLTRAENGSDMHHVKTTLEFEIHKRLKLDVSFEWDRIGSPKTEADSTTPLKDDFRFTTGLGIDF